MKASLIFSAVKPTGLALLTAIFLFTVFPARANSITGSGKVIQEYRDTSPFSAISVSNAIKLVITQGSEYQVIVSADDNLISRVKTEVSGNTLQIGLEPFLNLRRYKEITVFVTSPQIHKIISSGAAKVESTGVLRQESLELKSSGASKMNLSVAARYLEIEVSGASDITLNGGTSTLNAKISGASELKATGLRCALAEVELSGASEMKVLVSDRLTGKASGASSLFVKGNPAINVRTSGASSVSRR